MSELPPNFDETIQYFQNRLNEHGATPRGVDWNSETAQEVRFAQLAKVCNARQPFSLLDYGSGYGALANYLRKMGYPLARYMGYDILPDMVTEARKQHSDHPERTFTADLSELHPMDYVIASGIFNIKLDASIESWRQYVIGVLNKIDGLAEKGFSFNMLTIYSDVDHMRPNLYYADPCFFFDYCKRHFSRNVALLHDYEVYDFTILVRK